MKYACLNHETYTKLLQDIDAYLLYFLSVYFCFHNLRLVKAQIKLKTFLKADNQGILGYFQSTPAAKRDPGHPFLSSLNISNQQEKFERKSFVSSISTESPQVTEVRIGMGFPHPRFFFSQIVKLKRVFRTSTACFDSWVRWFCFYAQWFHWQKTQTRLTKITFTRYLP